MLETWVFRLLVLVFGLVFVARVFRRLEIVWQAKGELPTSCVTARLGRIVREVVLQARVIGERPVVGVAHALVFWGFVAFAGYTLIQFLRALGVIDLTSTGAFAAYARALVPFAIAVLIGITVLLVRRVVLRPPALGPLSGESVLIGAFIATLMITFLLDFRLEHTAARVNWWVHALIILFFLVLIPGSKHLHLVLSPVTVFFRSWVLGDVRNLDFEKEEVGTERVADLERKPVLDAFTCVECGRCQDSCPAYATGKGLNPKRLVLQNEEALLEGRRDTRLVDLYDPGVLWQCTTCGACEAQCPVGVEHLPLIIGARRGLVSNGEAPDVLATVFNHLERRGNIWGLTADQRQRFVDSAGLEIFDPSRHQFLFWLGCAGSYDADFQKALRSLFVLLRQCGIRFGVLAKERCTGDPAKRTGNEYLFRELAEANIEMLRSAGATRILTACPHCLKTLGQDYRACGFEAEVIHAVVLLSALVPQVTGVPAETVALHDPCYLSRYAGHVREPRTLLSHVGASVTTPSRAGRNPFCCGGGGGLLFEEREQGRRISEERYAQLQATGAPVIVTACPFCAIMLKGAQASTNATTEVVDIAAYVASRVGVNGAAEARVPAQSNA